MAKNKAQQEQILLKNSDINIFLPENIKAGSNILIFGNTCNFFGVTNNIIFNNDNEFVRLGRLIDAINNKCNFYIICLYKETYEYYRHLFNEVIYHNFGIKAQVKALELIEVNSTNTKKEYKNKYSNKVFKKINQFNMHFDICLMNPPYGTTGGDDIHYRFTEKCILLCDKTICIMPFALVDKSTKPNPLWRKKLSPYITHICRQNGNIFESTNQTDLGIYTFIGENILKKKCSNYINTEHIIIEDLYGNIITTSELKIDPFNEYEKNIITFLQREDMSNIINFGYMSHFKEYLNSYIKRNNLIYNNDTKNEIEKLAKNERIIKESNKMPDNTIGIVCNFFEGSNKTGYHAKFFGNTTGNIIKTKEDLQKFLILAGTTSGYNLICVPTIAAANNCKIALTNNVLRFCLSKVQVDRCMQPKICYKYIPDIDWEDPRVTTDEGLLEVCGCPKDKAKEYAEYCRKKMEEFDNKRKK